MVSHLCGFSCEASNDLVLSIGSHTLKYKWLVTGVDFFHGSLVRFLVNTLPHWQLFWVP